MSYKDYLRQRIKEVQNNIVKNSHEIDTLKNQLKLLELQEFEEDMRESEIKKILLKG